MRVAFIVSDFPALSETFILNQIVGLKKYGYEVDIYAEKPRNDPKLHPDVEKYNLLSHTNYAEKMPKNRFWRLLKSLGLILINFPKYPVVMLRVLNFFKYGKKYGSLTLLYEVLPWLRQGLSYDIIHCHFGTNGLKGALLQEVGAIRGKLIVTFHGYDISKYLQSAGDRVYDRLFDTADLLLPISEYWKNKLIELGGDEKKIVVHRMGIDCKKFSFTLRGLTNNKSVRIVTIARLVEKKGVEYGIRAVAQLVTVIPNVQYLIIGDGPLKPDLQQLVQALNVGDTVKLLGWKQQSEIAEILEDANILLAPSVTSKDGDREGIPVAVMEAMARGLPILSTLHSGIPELIENGVSGFLVPERDADALAEKLRYLVTHPEVGEKMGRAGRAYVEERYDIEQLNKQLVELYQKVLN